MSAYKHTLEFCIELLINIRIRSIHDDSYKICFNL